MVSLPLPAFIVSLPVISGGSDADVFKLSYQDQAVKSGLTNLIKDFELGVDTLESDTSARLIALWL
jgi:hypothetical protein